MAYSERIGRRKAPRSDAGNGGPDQAADRTGTVVRSMAGAYNEKLSKLFTNTKKYRVVHHVTDLNWVGYNLTASPLPCSAFVHPIASR